MIYTVYWRRSIKKGTHAHAYMQRVKYREGKGKKEKGWEKDKGERERKGRERKGGGVG
jgi:hypothetical protein